MEITFDCPNCGATISTDDESAVGSVLPCPSCNERIMVPAPGIEPGMMLGNYRVDELLGAGGMGEVYAATQIALDRRVALKVLSPACLSDQNAVDRFMQEMRMAGKLMHPNIVTAFDAGTHGTYHYIAMTFVDGTDVETILKEDKRIPEDEALTVTLKVARALDHAWSEHGMLHRDLKPGNIMVDKDGEIKLMDMGLAKITSADAGLTTEGTFLGTPHYISPEQARNKDMDCRSDIYSLGATLFNMVTGQRPFRAANLMAIIAKHVSEPVPDPCTLNHKLSPACGQLIEKMMAKDPDDRYPDWKALQKAIEKILAGQSAAASSTSEGAPSQTDAKPNKNSTVLVLTIVAILGLVAVGAIGAWMFLPGIFRGNGQTQQPGSTPNPGEKEDPNAGRKPPSNGSAKPPLQGEKLSKEDLKDLLAMTAKMAQKNQYRAAAALLANRRDLAPSTDQIDARVREYKEEADRLAPLIDHARKAVALCLEGKHFEALEYAEEAQRNRDVRALGREVIRPTIGGIITCIRFREQQSETSTKKPSRPRRPRDKRRNPDGAVELSASQKAIYEALKKGASGKYTEGLEEAAKADDSLLKLIVIGELNRKLIAGSWRATKTSKGDLPTAFRLTAESFEAKFSDGDRKGKIHILGKWLLLHHDKQWSPWHISELTDATATLHLGKRHKLKLKRN